VPRRPPNPEDPHARHGSTPRELVRMNAAKRRGVPLLTWRDDGDELCITELHAGETCSIGRRATMSIPIGWDAKVSGLHATLECVGGEWVISDNGVSTNGTWVNGERIQGGVRLSDRDVIRVGSCLLAFHSAGSDERPVTTTLIEDDHDVIPTFDATDRLVLVELCRDYLVEGLPQAVETRTIAADLFMSAHTIKKRLGKMFARCGIDPDDELPRGQKRAELMRFVVQHGIISPRDYSPRRQE
jgi:hypothetical protein